MKHPYYETDDVKAMELAIRLHPKNGTVRSETDIIPTVPEAIQILRHARSSCGFNWITARAAAESSGPSMASPTPSQHERPPNYMTPEKQRIAIAEACGWKLVPAQTGQNPFTRPVWYGPNGGPARNDYMPPNYISDLNAMHEAEKVLWLTEKWPRYKKILRWVREREKGQFGYYDTNHATAAQRAEAFLRTLNLWDDFPVCPSGQHV